MESQMEQLYNHMVIYNIITKSQNNTHPIWITTQDTSTESTLK